MPHGQICKRLIPTCSQVKQDKEFRYTMKNYCTVYIPSYSATEAAVRAEVAEVVSPPEFRSFGFTAFVKLYNIHEKLSVFCDYRGYILYILFIHLLHYFHTWSHQCYD